MTGVVVWFTGLPASGKSTLARDVANHLRASGSAAVLLDGDEIRRALVPQPGYDDDGRRDFYATIGNLAVEIARQGLVVLVAATAHRASYRDQARAASPRFVEVFVDTPARDCAARDPKGLYARAANDHDSTLPGAGVSYEVPKRPEVVAHGGASPAAVTAVADAIERALAT